MAAHSVEVPAELHWDDPFGNNHFELALDGKTIPFENQSDAAEYLELVIQKVGVVGPVSFTNFRCSPAYHFKAETIRAVEGEGWEFDDCYFSDKDCFHGKVPDFTYTDNLKIVFRGEFEDLKNAKKLANLVEFMIDAAGHKGTAQHPHTKSVGKA